MDYLSVLEKEVEQLIDERQFESIEAAELHFEEGLQRALIKDDLAFSMISASMEFMRTNGDFARVQQMAMVLGATACTHEHMQELSRATSDRFADILHGKNHDHDHDHTDDDDEDNDDCKNTKKHKRSKRLWGK